MRARPNWPIATACAVLMVGAAALLLRFQSSHRLGRPGVKLADVGLRDETGAWATTNSIHLPEQVLDYHSELIPVQREELNWLPRDTTFGRRRYTGPDRFQVQVSGVLMGTDRTSIHKPEYCLPGQGFQILRRSQIGITVERPHRYRLPVTRLDALREAKQPDGSIVKVGAVYVYWFASDTRLSNNHAERMWWLALDLVRTGELQRWAYVGCLAACFPGQEDATYTRLERFIQDLVPDFQLTTGAMLAISNAVAVEPAAPSLSLSMSMFESNEEGRH